MFNKLRSVFNFQNLLLYGYMAVMTYLLYLRDVNEVTMNKLIFAFIVIAVSAISNLKTLISIILFTIPLMCGLPGNYFLPFWVICISWHMFFSKNKSSLPGVWFALFVICFELFHYMFYDFETSFIEVGSYCCSIFIICLLCRSELKIDYSYPILAFCIGCSVLLTIVFLMFVKGGDAAMVVEMSGRMGGDVVHANDEEMVLKTNANVIGLMSCVSIACALSLFYYKRIHVIVLVLLVSICFGLGLFSVSRTWALMMGIVPFLYVIFQRKNKWLGYSILGFLFIGAILFYVRYPEIFDIMFNRFTDKNIETGGDRTLLFVAYNDFLFDNLEYFLLGTGALYYKEVTHLFNSSHNGLQQIFISYGLVGFIVFVMSYCKLCVKYYVQDQKMALLPMICVFLYLQTLQSLNPIFCLEPIIAAFFVMKMVNQNKLLTIGK